MPCGHQSLNAPKVRKVAPLLLRLLWPSKPLPAGRKARPDGRSNQEGAKRPHAEIGNKNGGGNGNDEAPRKTARSGRAGGPMRGAWRLSVVVVGALWCCHVRGRLVAPARMVHQFWGCWYRRGLAARRKQPSAADHPGNPKQRGSDQPAAP